MREAIGTFAVGSQSDTDDPGSEAGSLQVTVADKRWAMGSTDRWVLDGPVAAVELNESDLQGEAANGWALSALPRRDLRQAYVGWRAMIESVLASRLTGKPTQGASGQPGGRREALRRHAERQHRPFECSRASRDQQPMGVSPRGCDTTPNPAGAAVEP